MQKYMRFLDAGHVTVKECAIFRNILRTSLFLAALVVFAPGVAVAFQDSHKRLQSVCSVRNHSQSQFKRV